MKTAQLLCLLFLASLTWGQATLAPSIVNGQPQPLRMSSNVQQAGPASMREQQSLVGSSYTSAKGERPLWEFAPPDRPTPLGDTARALRKQHETAKKAVIVREN